MVQSSAEARLELLAASPTTVTRERWPRALNLRTQKTLSGL